MRVMRVLTRCNLGGPTQQAIALWHAHRELGVATLLVTGAGAPAEAMLSPAAHGVPTLSLAQALAAGEHAAGWVEIPGLLRGIAPLGDHRAFAALRELLRAFQPTVVHTHTSKAGWLGRAAARASRVPTVHTFHGHVLRDYFAPPLQWWLRRLERRLARHTGRLLAVSASCADELAAAGVAERARFRVVPPAVPVVPLADRAAARAALGIPDGQQRVVCVGRLVPIKRVDQFVGAVARVDGLHGDVVGDGPLRASLQAGGDAGGRVHWRGAVAGIAANLAAYDALVLASVREGYPLVAVEACRAGVPVVGYDVPGVRDALAGGGGELVPPAAGPEGLAAALRRVLATTRGTAPRPASDAFAPPAVARELLDVYRELANGRSALP